MYRKRNGSLGFSFTDFAQNAVPSMSMSRSQQSWVPALGRDMLYAHQIAAKHPGAPLALDERSLFVGGICDAEGTSKRVFHKLGRAGILDEQGCVNTMKIEGKKFPHQITLLSQPRQRDLLDLLFWWEEECQRLRKLFDEEKAVTQQIKRLSSHRINAGEESDEDAALDENERAQILDHLKFEREKLRMRVRQRPSQRRADVESGTDQLLTEINTAATQSPLNRTTSLPLSNRLQHAEVGEPPTYYA